MQERLGVGGTFSGELIEPSGAVLNVRHVENGVIVDKATRVGDGIRVERSTTSAIVIAGLSVGVHIDVHHFPPDLLLGHENVDHLVAHVPEERDEATAADGVVVRRPLNQHVRVVPGRVTPPSGNVPDALGFLPRIIDFRDPGVTEIRILITASEETLTDLGRHLGVVAKPVVLECRIRAARVDTGSGVAGLDQCPVHEHIDIEILRGATLSHCLRSERDLVVRSRNDGFVLHLHVERTGRREHCDGEQRQQGHLSTHDNSP